MSPTQTALRLGVRKETKVFISLKCSHYASWAGQTRHQVPPTSSSSLDILLATKAPSFHCTEPESPGETEWDVGMTVRGKKDGKLPVESSSGEGEDFSSSDASDDEGGQEDPSSEDLSPSSHSNAYDSEVDLNSPAAQRMKVLSLRFPTAIETPLSKRARESSPDASETESPITRATKLPACKKRASPAGPFGSFPSLAARPSHIPPATTYDPPVPSFRPNASVPPEWRELPQEVHAIARRLGIDELRPLQAQAIQAILGGDGTSGSSQTGIL